MTSIVQLIITIIETIKEWLTGKREKEKLQKEKTEEAEKNLHEAVESGSLGDLQKAVSNLQKAKK